LSVTTKPSGASVYLDGTLVGVTPLTLKDVAAGTHRVKVSRKGYLDRESEIEVRAGGGGDVRLDLVKDPGEETVVSGKDQGGGGGEPKRPTYPGELKVVGLVAAGGAVAAVLLATGGEDKPNTAPNGGEIVSDPPVGLAGLASTLSVNGASDREGQSLVYTWALGDGASASGQSVSHLYATAGFYPVSVVVSDGELSTTVTGNHLVTSLTGSWTGAINGLQTRADIRQEATALAGTLTLVGAGGGSRAPLSGHVGAAQPAGFSYPVEFSAPLPCCGTIGFVGILDLREGINTLSGTAQGKQVAGLSWILNR
jgi:hypothetical protein